MQQCPICTLKNVVKNGIVRGKQRFKCKECKYNFTKTIPRGYPPIIKDLAINLTMIGCGYRNVSRVLNVSNVSVLQWARKASEYVANKVQPTTKHSKLVQEMKYDEMWNMINKKRSDPNCKWLLIEINEEVSFEHPIIAVTHKK